ncbi:cation diffusion facilitator family transporter [Thermoleptolyngbya sichuanensis XZ-Cy5]|uniref:cation diffusion facilitator family transporter n=1 Tax=Thermoleptolyngbya sichuanensis TaxID=2885951 RepID=UPI00240E459D|nr:cation diffusion facilitator family transporter [Thermoleptolyngbya sichuanensis]MDG2617196.1 cation diffusion facilitator family transporter [Thermoleptolyngbya sichuanensis XZ-Cy5]
MNHLLGHNQSGLSHRSQRSQVQKIQTLQVALLLLSSFFVLELSAAILSHSLSLVAESTHVCSDIVALGMTLAAHSMARLWNRRSSKDSSSNLPIDPIGLERITPSRIEAMAAFLNGLGLVAIALWVGSEAFSRFSVSQPAQPSVEGWPMLIAAGVGILVNGCNALWLHPCSHENLNFRGAFLHSLADVLTSCGVLIAAVAVSWLHWTWVDGAISLLVSALIFSLAVPLLFQSSQQLSKGYSTDGFMDDFAGIRLGCKCDRPEFESLLFPTLQDCLK